MAAAVISMSSKVAALAALFVVLAMYTDAASPNGGWQAAKATWYGAPNGAGPDDNGTCVRPRTRWVLLPSPVCMSDVVVSYICAGGACGFKNTNQYPYMSMTSCGNEPLFKDGKGCGACYQVVEYSTNKLLVNPDTVTTPTWSVSLIVIYL
jgi:hypothetical protein